MRAVERTVVVLALVTVLAGMLGGAVAHRDVPGAIVASARSHLRAPPEQMPRRDCSGLVMSVLARAGVPAEGDSSSFWWDAVRDGRAFETGEPEPGDLAFFDRTWDKNRNGLVDDELTHVAVVIAVHEDGLVELVHKQNSGIRRLRLDLAQPDVHEDGPYVRNDYLRSAHYGNVSTPRLAGQLLRGFAHPPER